MFGRRVINNPIYFPLLASEEINGGAMSKHETETVWSRFDMLSNDRKNILTAEEMPIKIQELQQKTECSDVAIEGASVLIRWVFFDEIDEEGFRLGLKDLFGDKAEQAFDFIQKDIMTLKPTARVEQQEEVKTQSQSTTVRMPLLQALSKYEQLGNQLITSERIRVKSQSEPVRPSLLYWIKYYRDELGIGHHDTVQRGDFLFRSENGKRLSAEERERVNLVLKSVEENFPLEIDTERSEIVFPVFETSAPVFPSPPPAPRINASSVFASASMTDKMRLAANPAFSLGRSSMTTPAPAAPLTPVVPKSSPMPSSVSPQMASGGEMSFSSKHVFPAEKDVEAPVRQVSPAPASPQRTTTQGTPKSNPFRIHPVSLGEPDKSRTI